MNGIIENELEKLCENKMQMDFLAVSQNEALARMIVTGFVLPLNPTVEELSDIKTAVSEAVTNAIIHGYQGKRSVDCMVHMQCSLKGDVLVVSIIDDGVGMEDVEKAMEPLFTTKPDLERSGMGFAFMEAFMDDLQVESKPGCGTNVTMVKKLGTKPWIADED